VANGCLPGVTEVRSPLGTTGAARLVPGSTSEEERALSLRLEASLTREDMVVAELTYPAEWRERGEVIQTGRERVERTLVNGPMAQTINGVSAGLLILVGIGLVGMQESSCTV